MGRRKKLSCDRDWAELHPDVLMAIFVKMGTLEVLRVAGSVCRSWRKVAKEEPQLWRRIHVTNRNSSILMDLIRLAIDRSKGQLEELSVDNLGDDDLLQYLCDRTSVLKKLRMSCSRISKEAIVETAKRQPLLEEINITFGCFYAEVTEIIGRECPQLKTFRFNYIWEWDNLGVELSDDKGAFGIANTMHQLRHLQLIQNSMTNGGLRAILNGCPHLETLDIRQCCNVNMDADMWALCARLKTIRFPEDTVEFSADGTYIFI